MVLCSLCYRIQSVVVEVDEAAVQVEQAADNFVSTPRNPSPSEIYD